MLDTNICIYIQRHQPPEVYAHFQKLKPGDVVVSIITWGELLYGAEKSQKRAKVIKRLEEFSTLIPVLPMTSDVAQHYGSLRGTLEKKGQVIGNNDLWIAAHAKAANLILVTNNVREFQRVPGLKVQNWVK